MQQVARYIPAGARAVKSRKAEAVVYVHERNGVPFAIAYAFKRGKPEWNFRFRNEADRAKRIELFFKGIEAAEVYLAEQKARAKELAKPGNVKVGQVFVSSWGYDQTNVDFYEIVALKGAASAMVVKIPCDTLEGSEGQMCAHVLPSTAPDRAAGKEPFMVRIKGNRIVSSEINGRGGASAWEGKPQYQSWYA